MAKAAETVLGAVRAALTGPQVDALISLCFNIGIPRFLTSTVLRRVNAKQLSLVPAAFRMWVKETIDGKLIINQGLVNRREADINLWNSIA